MARAEEVIDGMIAADDPCNVADFADKHGAGGDIPAHRLFFAVMHDAIEKLSGKGTAAEQGEAWRWLNDRGEHAFSFESVCDALGVDESALRRAIKARTENGVLNLQDGQSLALKSRRGRTGLGKLAKARCHHGMTFSWRGKWAGVEGIYRSCEFCRARHNPDAQGAHVEQGEKRGDTKCKVGLRSCV